MRHQTRLLFQAHFLKQGQRLKPMPTVFTGRKRDSVSDGIGLWMSRDAWLPTNLRHGWTMLNLSVAWASHQTGLVKCVGNQQWKIKQEASYEKHTHRHEKQSEYRRINSDFSSNLKCKITLCVGGEMEITAEQHIQCHQCCDLSWYVVIKWQMW